MFKSFILALKDSSFLISITLILFLFFIFFIFIKSKINFSTKFITYASLCISISTILSRIVLLSMPNGGSVTAFSMLFICLIGYWFNTYLGIVSGFIYGILQIIVGPLYILHPAQLFLDYILAFSVLGLSGLFKNKRFGLYKGYIFAVSLRLLVSTISGYIFFMDIINNPIGSMFLSLFYNSSYIIPEMLITILLITVPSFNNVINILRVENNLNTL